MLPLRPNMASLSVGSNNFPTRVYENPPYLVDWVAAEMVEYDVKPEIEAFDLSHIFQASKLHADGKIAASPYVQFVMGVQNAMPVDGVVFDFYVKTVRRLFGEDVPWCAAGIGRHQMTLNQWAIAAGGHVRTGLEDNVRLDRDRLAPSNAALVRRATDICAANNRPVATPARSARVAGPATHRRVRARVQPGRPPCAAF
jgi:3-oxoadipate:acetyl-CoA acetyltransferase